MDQNSYGVDWVVFRGRSKELSYIDDDRGDYFDGPAPDFTLPIIVIIVAGILLAVVIS